MKRVLMVLWCFVALMTQAQTKVCMSYADFVAGQWKPYESLTEDKKPDSCRVKYDGMEFSIKTDDKEVNQIIKKKTNVAKIRMICLIRLGKSLKTYQNVCDIGRNA